MHSVCYVLLAGLHISAQHSAHKIHSNLTLGGNVYCLVSRDWKKQLPSFCRDYRCFLFVVETVCFLGVREWTCI